jgi:hypothetical protein
MAQQATAKYDLNGSRYVGREFFVYDCNIRQNGGSSLAPSATANLSININGDSDFFWQKFNIHANTGDDGTTRAAEVLAEVSLLITNTTTGRSYSNVPVPAADISGNGQLPFILPMLTVFEAKSTITIAIVNISDNATYTQLFLDFIGIKAYLAAGVQ